MPEGGLVFDINPTPVVGADNGTHFEQIYQRAKDRPEQRRRRLRRRQGCHRV